MVSLTDGTGMAGIPAAVVNCGAGTDVMMFIGAGSTMINGGSGSATVVADVGKHTFVAGSGSLDVTGGTGADAYLFHVGGGLLKVEDFSVAKGDVLTVDAALKPSMTMAGDSAAGTMIGFGIIGQGIDLAGIKNVLASQVHFT
jgi:Ca2+-binding RTX toxin-like protein